MSQATSKMAAAANSLNLKLIVVGDVGVGKTCIIRRYTQNLYSDNYKATIGVDFALKFLRYNDAQLTLQLWDIAGTLSSCLDGGSIH